MLVVRTGSYTLARRDHTPPVASVFRQDTDTFREVAAPITVVFDVHISVEGRLIRKGSKKGSKIGHRNISVVAVLSDGTYVSYFHTR